MQEVWSRKFIPFCQIDWTVQAVWFIANYIIWCFYFPLWVIWSHDQDFPASTAFSSHSFLEISITFEVSK